MESQPVLAIANRSFRYGDGFFESMRYMRGELKFENLHAARIRRGMELLQLQSHLSMDHHFLREQVKALAQKNETGPHARVRLTIFRNAGGWYSPTSLELAYVLEVHPCTESCYTSYAPGFMIDVFDKIPKPVNILSNIKTCNALLFVLAGIFKNKFLLDEVLILNQHGFLCEAMSSNLFVVYKKKIYTPALGEGCVAGIMRQVVIALARKNKLPVIEAQINPNILKEAEEVFLTNAVRGIQWVRGFQDKRYFSETACFLLEQLNELKEDDQAII